MAATLARNGTCGDGGAALRLGWSHFATAKAWECSSPNAIARRRARALQHRDAARTNVGQKKTPASQVELPAPNSQVQSKSSGDRLAVASASAPAAAAAAAVVAAAAAAAATTPPRAPADDCDLH